jgi:transposase
MRRNRLRVAGDHASAERLLREAALLQEARLGPLHPETPFAFSPNTTNKTWHKEKAIELRVLRFLPPYSPDFNPIELAFAKLKAFIRAARPRTFDHVCDLIAIALGLFTPTECRNFVRHCGYRVSTRL